MKKQIIIAGVIAAFAISCQVAQVDVADDVQGVEISILALQEPVTKTYLDFPSSIWEQTDLIEVFDGSSHSTFTVTSVDSTRATFSGRVNEGASAFTAIYPSTAAVSFSGRDIIANLPSEQIIGDNNVASGALLAVSSATIGEAFQFRNVCGLLGFEVSYSNVSEIKIEGPGVCGTVKIDAATGLISSVSEAGNSITVTPSGEVFAPGVYYISVLPVTDIAAGDFKVSMRRSDNSEAVKTTSVSLTVPRNGGLDFGKLDTKLSWVLHITNKEELFIWNDAYESWEAGDVVYIDNDIDMENDPWTPHAFSGTLLGQDSKLYNLNVNSSSYAGFISTLNSPGVVQDLVFGSSDGETYDGKSIILQDNTDATGYVYVGLIGDAKVGSSISNIKNFATIKVGSASMAKTVVGGVVGGTQGATVSDCVNYGEIIQESGSVQTNSLFVGGVIGNSYGNATTMSGCYNYANITSSCPMVYAIGGVLGRCSTASTLIDSYNYGTITSNAVAESSKKNNFYIGGVVGLNTSAAMTISGCGNSILPPDNVGGIVNNGLRLNEMFLGGILGFSQAVATVVENCVNECEVRNEGQGTYIYLGGIVGQNTGTSKISSCINRGDVRNNGGTTVAGAWAIRLGGVTGCQATASSLVSECENYGQVDNTGLTGNLSGNKEFAVGGISGHIAGGSTISDCTNYANFVWTDSMEGCAHGGIVGYVAHASCNVTGCHNRGSLTFKMSDDSINKGTSYFGGIAGWLNPGTVSDCHNHGAITSDLVNSNRMGGIAGLINTAGSVIENCTNEANLTVNFSEASTTNPCCVGGIVGCHDGNNEVTVKNSKNSGNVSLTCNVNTTNTKAVGAGGIIGVSSNGTLNLTDNTNSGNVTMLNVSHSTSGQYAGGIAGRLLCSASLSGNSNSGNVSASCTAETDLLAAGGVAGAADKTTVTVEGDSSKADITCDYAPMLGAIVGYNLGAFSGCKAGGKVGGVTLDANNLAELAQGSASTGSISGTTLY